VNTYLIIDAYVILTWSFYYL